MSEQARSALVRRLATNTAVQVGGGGVASAISFFTFAAVTRGLGPDAYGDFVAALAFVLIAVGVVDSGVSNAVLREISARPERAGQIMRSSFSLRLVVAAVSSVAMLALGYLLPLSDRAQDAIAIGSVGGFATLLYLALLPLLQAELRMHWAVLANVGGRLATLALTLGALAAGWGFTGVVWANVAGSIVTLGVDYVVVVRRTPLGPLVDAAYWRTLLRTSAALGAAIALALVYFRMDTLVLAMLVESRDVGLYGAAFKFLELSELVVIAAGASIFPLLTRLVAAGDPGVEDVAHKAFEILLVLAAPLAVTMICFADEIVELSAGPDFAESGTVLRLLAPYVLLSFGNGLLWRLLIAAHVDRGLLWIATISLAARLVLLVTLVPAYGYRAAAVAAVVAEAVALALALVTAWRAQRFRPRLRGLPVIAAAALAMAGVAVAVPGPALVAGLLGFAVYVLLLAVMPGTARDSLRLLTARVAPRT